MMSVQYFLVGMIVSMAARSCHGYGWGVPATVCDNMFPLGHKVDTMETEPPFVILVNKESYNPNDIIEIQVNARTDVKDGNDTWFYEGLFLQVRNFNCKEQFPGKGSFILEANEKDLQAMDCFKLKNVYNAVRHITHKHFYNKTFQWKAPATAVGHVIVRALVARNKARFWEVYSDVITDPSDNRNKNSLKRCETRKKYDKYEFCPERPTSANVATTSGVTALMLAAILFLSYTL